LREIAQRYGSLGSLEAVLASAKEAAQGPIMLKYLPTPEGLFGVYPWDPDYADALGEGMPCDAAMIERFRDFPRRFAVDPVTKMPLVDFSLRVDFREFC
jgi:hypothetical protein